MLFFQGIGINSQGFTNFILFVWCTTKIREKLIMGCVHFFADVMKEINQ